MTVHDEVVAEVDKKEKLDKWIEIWDNSGREKINKYFPGLIIDSDCHFTERYFK